MKCPYRKITYHYHHQAGTIKPAYDEEGFAECYGKDCPFYDNGVCKRSLKKGDAK